MERKVTRAEQLLNRIAKQTGMTKSGKDWLIKATDPFHDFSVETEGFPDGSTGDSVIQYYTLTTTIHQPATVASDEPWDVVMTIDDNPYHSFAHSYNIEGNVLSGSGEISKQGYLPYGGFTANAGPVNSELSVVKSVGNEVESTSLTIPLESTGDKMRVISQAFEVRNETAELYKQGNVVCFEQPINEQHGDITLAHVAANGPDFFVDAMYAAKPRLLPPKDQAEATLLPGSVTWEAREGCYVVGALESLQNSANFMTPKAALFVDQDDFVDTQDLAGWPGDNSTVYGSDLYTTTYGLFRKSKTNFLTPFSRKGAYFSGLSPQTVLKVTYRVGLERFPGPKSKLVTLARPCPPRDIAALECYSEIMSRMPIAVPVKENGLGDWFTGAVASLVDGATGTRFASSLDKWQKEQTASSSEKEIQQLKQIIEELKSALAASAAGHNYNSNGINSPKPQNTQNFPRGRQMKGQNNRSLQSKAVNRRQAARRNQGK